MTDPAQPSAPPGIPPEPAPSRSRQDGPRYGSVIVGLAILAIGLWYFADRTLGLEMPDLDPGQLWPVAIIAVGVWMIVRPRS
jgi:hypothetical protein